jgi:hypothetical protein
MKKNTPEKKNARGSALVYALMIMFAVSVILTSLIGFIVSQTKYGFQVAAKESSLQISESGMNFYRWYLAHMVEGKTAKQIQDFWLTGNPLGVATPYEAEYFDPGGTAIGKYSLVVTPPPAGSTMVIVNATGWTYRYPNSKRHIRVRFRRPSWSENMVVANDVMRFGEGTVISGKVHSNQGIRFDGVAHNLVTSSVASYNDPDHSDSNKEFGVHTHVNVPPTAGVNNTYRSLEAPPAVVPSRPDVFQAGRSFPVPTVDFTGVLADLNVMKTEAQTGAGKYFDATGVGRNIILKTDGTFDSCTVSSFDAITNGITNYKGTITAAVSPYNGTNGNACTMPVCTVGAFVWVSNANHNKGKCTIDASNNPIPAESVIFVENNVWLEGKVDNKHVTIVAADITSGSGAKNVFIGKDITYANTDGKDIIGVIAQNDVEIIQNSNNILTINAALLAQNGRIGRDNYGTSDHKSTITVSGAMATNKRYGFSWTNGVSSWGYTTRNLYYDNNLLYFPPPYFPTGTQYLMDLWEEL